MLNTSMKQTDNIFIDQGKSFSLRIETLTNGKTFYGYIRKHILDSNKIEFEITTEVDFVEFNLAPETTSSVLTNLTQKTWVYELLYSQGTDVKVLRSGNAIIEPGVSMTITPPDLLL